MDHKYYTKLWLEIRLDLERVMKYDDDLMNFPPIENRKVAEFEIIKLYYRYRSVIHRLIFCYDQIVQPQIREFVEKMLDFTIVRMLEIRQEMVNFSFIDYPWTIEPLLQLQLTFDDVELTAPSYNYMARLEEKERQKALFENFLATTKQDLLPTEEKDGEGAESVVSDSNEFIQMRGGGEGEEGEGEDKGEEEVEPKEKFELKPRVILITEEQDLEEQIAIRKAFNDAVLLIQSHERARVARGIAAKVIRVRILRKRLETGQLVRKKVNKEEQIAAAIIIQKIWRGFAARRRYQEKKYELEKMIGMTIESGGTDKGLKELNACLMNKAYAQANALKEYKKFEQSEKKRLLETRGPNLLNEIREEIRVWFFEWYNSMGFFDYIPPVESGGSVLITTGQCRTPSEYFASLQQDKVAPPEESDYTPKMKTVEGWQMQASQIIPRLLEVNEEYTKKWNMLMLKMLDPNGALITEFIYEDICETLQREMREIADESMRAELDIYNEALVLDKEGDFTFPKPQEWEVEVEEEIPAEELLPARTDDELLIDLMKTKVLQDTPECYLRDWDGAPSYADSDKDEIRLGDVIQAVMDYCVLPIGSKIVHTFAPLVRSVCICGPRGAGQLFIARAICTELKATVFDLTPAKLRGKYKSKSSQKKLVKTVIRLARTYAPSVVLVEGDTTWLKTDPIELRRINPKRFSSIYWSIVNSIMPGDQVLFLTVSDQPHLTNRTFLRIHDKFIVIPVVDYGTMVRACKRKLMKHHSIPRHFQVSSISRTIAKVTPIEFAYWALDECTKIDRRMTYKRKPLKPMEILEMIQTNRNIPEKAELERFENFHATIPLKKKRIELLDDILQAELLEQSQKK